MSSPQIDKKTNQVEDYNTDHSKLMQVPSVLNKMQNCKIAFNIRLTEKHKMKAEARKQPHSKGHLPWGNKS